MHHNHNRQHGSVGASERDMWKEILVVGVGGPEMAEMGSDRDGGEDERRGLVVIRNGNGVWCGMVWYGRCFLFCIYDSAGGCPNSPSSS